MRAIDSHCHIHDTEFFSDNREEVYQRAAEAGVGVICVGTDVRSSLEAVDFAKSHQQAWAVVGMHPHDTKNGWDEIMPLVARARSHIVGIGEIGLDYFYNNSPREIQLRGLEAQLDITVKYDLPVSFHVREAFDDFWPIFDNFPSVRGVLHSFTDSMKNLERGLSNGLFIGVNGISTFTKDEAQQRMFRAIPLEKMLLETDAPFLTPKPKRGKMNESKYVEYIAKHVAHQRDISLQEVLATTCANTRHIFKI